MLRSLPKVELHAHLNGSLSCGTIEKLLQYHKTQWPDEAMPEGSETWLAAGLQGTLDDPFRAFGLIHRITDNTWAASQATKDVIKEFYEDGVVYLELRTTPRKVEGRMEKEDYLRTVLTEIKTASSSLYPNMIVKLLISVDRRNSDFFDEHVQLYHNMKKEFGPLVAGIDISGDPRQQDITLLLPKLIKLREENIKLAIHLAEVPNEREVEEFLKFKPDRIGHGTCIHPSLGGSDNLWNLLKASGVPVEVCLTSNLIGGNVPSLSEHHINHFDLEKVPYIICTDDKGVFSSHLSQEYDLACREFNWDTNKIFQVAFSAIDHCFATEEEKQQLRDIFFKWKSLGWED